MIEKYVIIFGPIGINCCLKLGDLEGHSFIQTEIHKVSTLFMCRQLLENQFLFKTSVTVISWVN